MKTSLSRGNPKRVFLVFGILAVVMLILLSSFNGDVDNTVSHNDIAKGLPTTADINEPFANTSSYRNTEYSGDSVAKSNGPDIYLGNVTGSYLQNVSIPVYLYNGSNFTDLTQLFSFDPSLLRFTGIINDVSSQNVTFTAENLTDGIVKVYGNGSFVYIPYITTLCYLEFSPVKKTQISTTVLLDYFILNDVYHYSTSSSSVLLARGWTNFGPRNLSISLGVPGGAYMSLKGTGMTNAIAFSPYFPNIIYEGSGSTANAGFGGIMKSTDGGLTWEQVDLGINFTMIQSIWVDPSNPDVVVSIANEWGDSGGVFKTVNGGASWQETYNGAGDILQFVPGVGLYAIMEGCVLFSPNLGSTWKVISTTSDSIASGLVLNNGSKIELAANILDTSLMGIFLSSNGGVNYSLGQTFKTSGLVNMIADPSNSSIQWMTHWQGYTNDSLYKSTDGGLTWRSVNYTSIGISSFAVGACPAVITYAPSNASVMYMGGDAWEAKSVNGGNTFSLLMNVVEAAYVIVVDPLNDSTVYVGGEQGVFASHDGGNTWGGINNRSSSITQGIAIDGNNSIISLGNFNPFYSTDNGSSWIGPPRYVGIIGEYRFEGGVETVDPFNSSIIMYAAGQMEISHDGGLNYSLPQIDQAGVDNPAASEMDAFAFLPNSSTIFYAGNLGIFVSNDSGYIWNVLDNSPRNCSAITGEVVANKFVLYASNYSGFFSSSDYGLIWSKINNDHLETISIDPYNPSVIAATISTEAMISHDGGKTFSYANQSSTQTPYTYMYPGIIYQKFSNGSTILYFISNHGVSASTDEGKTWDNVTYNLPTLVITTMEIYGNTCYVTTQGSGLLYDPSLSDLSFNKSQPVISGYLPSGSSATIDDTSVTNEGYFSIVVSAGNESIYWNGKEFRMLALEGQLYFLNFSSLKIKLSLSSENLPAGVSWKVFAGGSIYTIKGNETIEIPPESSQIYVYPVSTDYSIYYPSHEFYNLSAFLIASISVSFSEQENVSSVYLSSKISGVMWDAGSVYNDGHILYYGQGLDLFNVSDDSFMPVNSQIEGYFRSAVSFGSGFVLGGSNDGNGGILGFYNLSDMNLENITSLVPQTWQHMVSGTVTSVTASRSSIYIALIASGHNYLGELSGTKFTNLTSYIYPYQYSNGEQGLAVDYIGSINAIVFSTYWNQGFLGLLYLSNLTTENLTAMLPQGTGIGNVMSTSSAVLSSGQSSFDIVGTASNGTGYVGIFEYSGSSFQQTDTWLPYFSPSSTEWDGHDYIVSGQWSNGDSYLVAISLSGMVSYIPSGVKGYGPMMNSATSINYSRFAIVYYYNGSIFNDYYTLLRADTVSAVRGFVTPNNGSLYINDMQVGIVNSEFSFPVFSGNVTISISAPGYVTSTHQLYVPPFSTSWVNLSLNTTVTKVYWVVFNESGLPSGTIWSVTLNGTTRSSTGNISFTVPNGTYSYSIGSVSRYSIVSVLGYNESSGYLTVDGYNLSHPVTFVKVISKGFLTGSIYPLNASISINGTIYQAVNGQFNISLNPGTYEVKVSAPGYVTYTTNLTISSSSISKLPIQSLTKMTTPSSFSILLIIVIAVIIMAAVIAAVVLTINRRKKS